MTENRLRIAFMGTPDFALEALKAICADDRHDVVCVYSQPPRPKGRGHKVQKSPVHEYADTKNIPVLTPKSLKNAEAQEEFASFNADVAVVAAYGLILPKAVLEAPKRGCINIHASLLPRWRGAAPIQYAIWSGDQETGVTLMQMDEGLDTGPEIIKETLPITGETTSTTLHDDLAVLGGNMIVKTLNDLAEKGALPSTPQDEENYTYAPMLKKEDGRVDWSKRAADIDRQIRALNPWPGVYTDLNGKRLKIKTTVLSSSSAGQSEIESGKILNKQGEIVCGDGQILKLLTIQPEGKKAMDFASALNGGYVSVGDIFS